jgi:hypothetical protein
MTNQFDELTKSLAQSVTRRAALKKCGLGLAGMALACFGLAGKAEAGKGNCLPGGTGCADSSWPEKLISAHKYCGRCCNGYTCDRFVGICYCQ